MAKFNYAGLAQRADKIMRRFGMPRGDPEAQVILRRGSEEFGVTALEATFAGEARHSGLAEMDAVDFLVSAVGLDVTPSMETDLLILRRGEGYEDETYRIVEEPRRTAPGGVNVFWQIRGRRE